MKSGRKPTSKKPAVAVLALLALVLGYWGYAALDRRAQERAVLELVAQATVQLRTGLAAERTPAAAVTELEQDVERLQQMKATRAAALANQAELYVISAREILRRREAGAALEGRAAASRAALHAHMALAHRRGPGWIQDAAALKRKVELDHGDLARTLDALDELLATLPQATKALAPHVERNALLDEAVRNAARRHAQEEKQRAERSLAEARRIGA